MRAMIWNHCEDEQRVQSRVDQRHSHILARVLEDEDATVGDGPTHDSSADESRVSADV